MMWACEPVGLRACGPAGLEHRAQYKQEILPNKAEKHILESCPLTTMYASPNLTSTHRENERLKKNKNLSTFQFMQDSAKGFIYIGFFTCTVFPSNTFIGASFTLA